MVILLSISILFFHRFHRGEQDDVADGRTVRQQHHQAVYAQSQAARRGHAVFQRGEEILIEHFGFVVAALALLAGFVYLLWRRVITWHIPVTVLVTMALFAFVVALARGESGAALWQFPLFHVLAGGAMLGAIFMATDYSTSPMTVRGGVIFAVGIGLITMLIRLWGAYPEGMSFAILIMNSCVPLINKYVKPKRFGVK